MAHANWHSPGFCMMPKTKVPLAVKYASTPKTVIPKTSNDGLLVRKRKCLNKRQLMTP